MNDLVLFQSFFSEEEAVPLIEILKANGILYKLEKQKNPLDATLSGQVVENMVYLNIRPQDFAKANEALDKVILNNIQSIGEDYYLFSFTNEELNDIIHKPDEWSRQDFLIARKILDDRGVNVSDEKINTIKSARIKELAVQEKGDAFWIFLGYVLSLVGGIMAIAIALPFILAKKALPDGNRIFMYNSKTRNHGKIILSLTGVFIIINAISFPDNLWLAFFGFISHRF